MEGTKIIRPLRCSDFHQGTAWNVSDHHLDRTKDLLKMTQRHKCFVNLIVSQYNLHMVNNHIHHMVHWFTIFTIWFTTWFTGSPYLPYTARRVVVASAPDRRFAFRELHQDFSDRGNPLLTSIRLRETGCM